MPRNADNLTLREIGAIAQLVERFHGMEEVRSSILLSSTGTLRVPSPFACGKTRKTLSFVEKLEFLAWRLETSGYEAET